MVLNSTKFVYFHCEDWKMAFQTLIQALIIKIFSFHHNQLLESVQVCDKSQKVAKQKMNIVITITYLFWIVSINFTPGNSKAIPGKFVIKLYNLYLSFRQVVEFSSCELQWNLELRKILGVTKIFLKSRFFLISNTRRNP